VAEKRDGMDYTYLPLAYRMAASMDAMLYGIRQQFAGCEPELIWDEFANEMYRRGGGDVGEFPEWMGA